MALISIGAGWRPRIDFRSWQTALRPKSASHLHLHHPDLGNKNILGCFSNIFMWKYIVRLIESLVLHDHVNEQKLWHHVTSSLLIQKAKSSICS